MHRLKYLLFVIPLTWLYSSACATEYKQGLWIGYSHGIFSGVTPDISIAAGNGYWSSVGFGYDRVLSTHFAVAGGYQRSALYDFTNEKNKFPISFMHGLDARLQYYPLTILHNSRPDLGKIAPYISLGLNLNYWSIDAIDKYESWEGFYVLPELAAGAVIMFGEYTMLHAGLGLRTTVAGKIKDLDGLSGQVRISYDLHINKQKELQVSYNESRRRIDSLSTHADSMSLELRTESDKIRFAIDEYETLLKGMAHDMDSIQAAYKKLQMAHSDTVVQFTELKSRYTDIRHTYDSIRFNSWDTFYVIRQTDSTHFLSDQRNKKAGTYLVLFTGERNRIIRELYNEVSTEYPRVWLVENYYGVQRVMIWLSNDQLDKEWKRLSISFSDLRKVDP